MEQCATPHQAAPKFALGDFSRFQWSRVPERGGTDTYSSSGNASVLGQDLDGYSLYIGRYMLPRDGYIIMPLTVQLERCVSIIDQVGEDCKSTRFYIYQPLNGYILSQEPAHQ